MIKFDGVLEMAALISLVKGEDRYQNVRRALEMIREDVQVAGARRIVVKPNFTSATRSLAVTHVEAVRALLDFLVEMTAAPILIAEGSGMGASNTLAAFRSHGYLALKERYPVSFLDLNRDEAVVTQIFDAHFGPVPVRVSKTILEADYRISICPPKTHDAVILTASLKNLVMGSLLCTESGPRWHLERLGDRFVPQGLRAAPPFQALASRFSLKGDNDKLKVHQGFPAMNLSLYRLGRLLPPHLSVIDGFMAMEGEGPVEGRPLHLGVAITSTDFVAADALAANLMGFQTHQIGYLHYCHQRGLGEGDPERMEIQGERWRACVRRAQPHSTLQAQLRWQIPKVERYLE